MKNIFFLTDIGFSKRDFERFLIKDLQKYYNIYIIDFSFLNKKVNRLNLFKEKSFKVKHYFKLKNIDNFFQIIDKISCDYAVDLITTQSNKSLLFKKLLKIKKIKLIYIQAGLIPENIRKFNEKINRFINLIFNPFYLIKKIFLVFKNFIFQYKFKTIPYDLVFISGKKGLADPRVFFSKKKVFSHSLDYEKFLNKKKKLKQKKYFIFLDQYLPFHPAQFYRNESPQVTVDNYFKSLINFFDIVEKKFKVKVVVSAHPRANKKLYKKLFNKRLIYFSNTLDLVQNSLAVLAHTSTAISYAVLFKKPIIFITTNEIIKSYDDYRVHSNSRLLDSFLINIDKKKELDQFKEKNKLLNVNKHKYKIYIDNYIKHPLSKKISLIKSIRKNLL